MISEISVMARLLTIKQDMIDNDMTSKQIGMMEDVINDLCEDYADRTDGDLIEEAKLFLNKA